EVLRQLPHIPGDGAEEEAPSTVKHRLAIAKRIQSETDAGRDVVEVCIDAADRHAGISGKELTGERHRRYGGLHTGLEDRIAALGVGWSGLNVIAKPQIDGQSRRQPEVVLRE